MAHYPHLPRHENPDIPGRGYPDLSRPTADIKVASLVDRATCLKHKYNEAFEHTQRIRSLLCTLAGNFDLPSDKVPTLPPNEREVPYSSVLSTIEDCHGEFNKLLMDMKAIREYLELRV